MTLFLADISLIEFLSRKVQQSVLESGNPVWHDVWIGFELDDGEITLRRVMQSKAPETPIGVCKCSCGLRQLS